MRPTDHGLKALKLWAQINFFSLQEKFVIVEENYSHIPYSTPTSTFGIMTTIVLLFSQFPGQFFYFFDLPAVFVTVVPSSSPEILYCFTTQDTLFSTQCLHLEAQRPFICTMSKSHSWFSLWKCLLSCSSSSQKVSFKHPRAKSWLLPSLWAIGSIYSIEANPLDCTLNMCLVADHFSPPLSLQSCNQPPSFLNWIIRIIS
jgi:hypothetical protein